MFFSKRIIVLVLTVSSVLFRSTKSAPSKNRFVTTAELEDIVVKFLDEYYERNLRKQDLEENSRKNVNIYDNMQGDQPYEENNVGSQQRAFNLSGNVTDTVLQASRNR